MTAPTPERVCLVSCRTCGWCGSYRSQGLADYALRRHSCAKKQRLDQARRKRVAAEAAIDRTPRPCNHQSRHQHGTRNAYVLDQCRCRPCTDAASKAQRERDKLKAYGRYDRYADAEPVRAHLRKLMDYGIGLKQVTRLTGIGGGTLTKLMYVSHPRTDGGPSQRILHTTAAALLSVEARRENLAPSTPDPYGSPEARIKLQALIALGWSRNKLSAESTASYPALNALISGSSTASRRTVDAVEDLYSRLSMTLPPQLTHRDKLAASRAKREAKHAGWPPPLELEARGYSQNSQGVELEDYVAIERRLAGDLTVKLSRRERVELVRLARNRNITLTSLADRKIVAAPWRDV